MKKLLFYFFGIISLLHGDGSIWTVPEAISNIALDSSEPDLVMDSAGNVTAVWIENGIIQTKEKPFGSAWSSATTLSGPGASLLKAVIDNLDNVTIIWLEAGVVNTRTKTLGTWSATTNLSGVGATSLDIAVNPLGNLVAVWALSPNIESRTKLFGLPWSSVDTITSSGGSIPKVAMGNGNVVSVWQDTTGSFNAIFASEKALAGSWSAPVTISDTFSHAAFPNIDVSSQGNAIAVWYRYNNIGSVYTDVILSMAYKPAVGSWDTPENVSSPGVYDPANLNSFITFGTAEHALFFWLNSFDGSTFDLNWRVRTQDGSFTEEESTSVNDLYLYAFDVTTDLFDNTYVNFMHFDKNSSERVIQSSGVTLTSPFRTLWGYFCSISSGADNAFPKVTTRRLAATSELASVWINYNGVQNIIYAATGSILNPLPPTGLNVVQNVNAFGVFDEYFNVLTWVDVIDPDVILYAIYRNDVFLEYVIPGVQTFTDHNQLLGVSVTYGIRSVSSNGFKSELVTGILP